jgi:hypothetical protein
VARAPLLAVVAALFAMVVLQSAGAVTKGQQRVLLVLATAGAKPYTVSDVEATARQVDAFFRTSSLGLVRLAVDVTPWLPAFNANPGCGFEAALAPARLAAGQAGYNPARYDDAVYAIAESHCAFHGETWGREVMLTRQPTLQLLVHELGHAFGLGHAQASTCIPRPLRCSLDETGDPFSPMGAGVLDFSAYEKVTLGWLPSPPHVSAPGRYVLATPTFKTKLPQALVVDTEEISWWIEYRSQPFRGLVVRSVAPRQALSPFTAPSVLLLNPTKTPRPWIGLKQSYRIPDSYRITLVGAGKTQAQLLVR